MFISLDVGESLMYRQDWLVSGQSPSAYFSNLFDLPVDQFENWGTLREVLLKPRDDLQKDLDSPKTINRLRRVKAGRPL